MQILHNMAAVMAATQHGINASNFQKSSQKLASGYRINTAADDAAQLSISEKMRSQIRGLNRAVSNAEEGANYIQVADGAMNEIHDMIHRMRELAIQSLNDTNTPQDRAAMAMEIDKIQAEIDRIDTNTYFNTLPVFQEHEPSYYQIKGNRVWAFDQQHAIAAPDNSMNIHLPAGEYNPDTYTITVSDGIYTTQELIDEIDDALTNLSPTNPGFVLEYTQDGLCCLNFEDENGQPTKIDSVDGSLAYLIYDCYNGLSSTSLLGTTAFQGNWPLQITSGQNDELEFQIEPTDGSPSTTVSITIPPGRYVRSEIIDFLNKELAAYPNVKATEYGTNCIQITGGFDNSITGLKGNMFKLELGSEHIYTSVFYDNIRYGTSIGTPTVAIGNAYYNASYTEEIEITNANSDLKFKYKGNTITVPIPPGKYKIQDARIETEDNLTFVLNRALKNISGADVSFTCRSKSVLFPDAAYSVSCNHLVMTSNSTGSDVTLEFEKNDAYESLFTTTNYKFDKNPTFYQGSNNLQITGQANLSGPITIPGNANTLSLTVNGQPVTMTIPARTYNSLNDLIAELNNQLPASQSGMIKFAASGSKLIITRQSDSVTDIDFANTSGAYTQLFTGHTDVVNIDTKSDTGQEHYPQGGTFPDISDMASVTMSQDIPQSSTTIDDTNNKLGFDLNGRSITITLANGTYSRAGLIAELNRNFKAGGYPVEASLSGNRLTLTTTLTGNSTSLSLRVDTRYDGSAWKAFVGTHPVTTSHSKTSPVLFDLRGVNNTDITLDTTNNKFVFQLDDKKNPPTEYEVELAPKKYTQSELATALQTALDTKLGGKKMLVSVESYGIRLRALTPDYNIKNPSAQNSGFYNTVFKKQVIGTTVDQNVSLTPGEHNYQEAFIIGRYDLTTAPVEIVSGMNDKFILDFTYKSRPSDPTKDYMKTLEVTLPAGTYTGTQIADFLGPALNAELQANNIQGFKLEATIGGHNTGVLGAIDDNALQIALYEENNQSSAPGSYILDGVRGSAASSIFYKTSGKPQPSYVTGAQDITGGVIFPPDKNTFTFKTDGQLHSYTFPKEFYNADEVVDFLNDKFEHGDDFGNTAPLVASLENGRLKLTHKVLGSHAITEVGGSAKGIVFYQENNRKSLDAFMLQVGALGHQGLELPRLRVNTTALKINSITISRPKYAEKALQRLDAALNLLSEKRSTYGALYNRIEHLNANNRNTSQNVQSSESRIRDAEMASEMVEYLKHKLLTEVSDSVLAQANQLPNRLLNLLL